MIGEAEGARTAGAVGACCVACIVSTAPLWACAAVVDGAAEVLASVVADVVGGGAVAAGVTGCEVGARPADGCGGIGAGVKVVEPLVGAETGVVFDGRTPSFEASPPPKPCDVGIAGVLT